jgi:hypothetical protein
MGLALGVFALLSGAIGATLAFHEWSKAGGGREELVQGVFALVVIATACVLLVLGAQAARALGAPPHQLKSGEPAMQLLWYRSGTELSAHWTRPETDVLPVYKPTPAHSRALSIGGPLAILYPRPVPHCAHLNAR